MSHLIALTNDLDTSSALAESLTTVGAGIAQATETVVTAIVETPDAVVVDFFHHHHWFEHVADVDDVIGAGIFIETTCEGHRAGTEQLMTSARDGLADRPIVIGTSTEMSTAWADWAASLLTRSVTEVPVCTFDPKRPGDIITILATVLCLAGERPVA